MKNNQTAIHLSKQHPKPNETPQSYWDRTYAARKTPSNGRPSAILEQFVKLRKPGQALELGCGRGDDAIWLANQCWTVTAVDISLVALEAASKTAIAAGMNNQIRFLQYDLDNAFPEGQFDLVSAMFLHSPFAFARTEMLRRVAKSVSSGGLLLIATHGSHTPWSSSDPNMIYPSPEEEFNELNLPEGDWLKVFVGSISRTATGPNEQKAIALDNVIAVERR